MAYDKYVVCQNTKDQGDMYGTYVAHWKTKKLINLISNSCIY